MRFVLRFISYIVIFGLTFSVSYVLIMRVIPATITPLKIVRLIDNDQSEIKYIRSKWVSLDQINMNVVRAVISSEDSKYLEHNGFDWQAIKQAIEYNKTSDKRRGASTISQQVAKNLFCLPNRTWLRKAVEAYYTVLIELLWSKERIMEVYLNIVELHPNVYGIEAAANIFFNKSASELNSHEASLIATVLPSPRRMNLASPSSYMLSRSKAIRRNMVQLGKIEF